MKMNSIEKFVMNNPIRAFIQKCYEAPLLERLGGRVEGMRVLEIGCGRGVGTEIILKHFGAREVHSFDIDPDMVKKAGKRLSNYSLEQLTLKVGDATAIDADDKSFDAVFNFWIIHHVTNWQSAVGEVSRVLKAGGAFSFKKLRAML